MDGETQDLECKDERAGEGAVLDHGHRQKDMIRPHHDNFPFDGARDEARRCFAAPASDRETLFQGQGRLRLEQTCLEQPLRMTRQRVFMSLSIFVAPLRRATALRSRNPSST
jgi:hypothetical protein